MLRRPAWAVVEFFRAVPVLMLMIFAFAAYGGDGGVSSSWCVVVALALYNGAVLAEVFRDGVDLAPGLTEVGKAISLEFQNWVQTALVVGAIFILVNLALSWVATRVQRRLVGENGARLSVRGDAGSGEGGAVPVR